MNIQKTTEKIGLLKYLRYRDEIFTKFNHLLNDNQATRKRLQVIAEKGPAVCNCRCSGHVLFREGRERAAEIAADQARAAASCVAS